MNFFYFNSNLFIRHMTDQPSLLDRFDDTLYQLYQLCKYPENKQMNSAFIKQCEVVGDMLIAIPSKYLFYTPFTFFNSLPVHVKRSKWARSFCIRGLENDPHFISFPHIFYIAEMRIKDEYVEYRDAFHSRCRQIVCDFFPIETPVDDLYYVGFAFYQKTTWSVLPYDIRKWRVRGAMLHDLQHIFNTDHALWDCWIALKYRGETEIYEDGLRIIG